VTPGFFAQQHIRRGSKGETWLAMRLDVKFQPVWKYNWLSWQSCWIFKMLKTILATFPLCLVPFRPVFLSALRIMDGVDGCRHLGLWCLMPLSTIFQMLVMTWLIICIL